MTPAEKPTADETLTPIQRKETPLLMCGEMVRAVLDGRKTQTRRVITFRECRKTLHFDDAFLLTSWVLVKDKLHFGESVTRCPYGAPGDRLWVKERFGISGNGYFYETDSDGTVHHAWTSSRFMPCKASRITLEITDVRVERVQDIATDDAYAEGVEEDRVIEHQGRKVMQFKQHQPGVTTISAVAAYSSLWDSLNAKRGFSWESNPWCWVISFRRIESLRT